jgi:hypothetical protein
LTAVGVIVSIYIATAEIVKKDILQNFNILGRY